MKISVFSLFRNSEATIHDSLNRFLSLLDMSDIEFEFFFYENDSTDNTRHILIDWCKDTESKLLHEDLGTPSFGSVANLDRLVLLSYYRNKLKRFSGDLDSDYCLLVDSDIIYDNENIRMLLDEIGNGWSMVTPNVRQHEIPDLMFHKTQDSFYDVFATRDNYFNQCLFFTDCPFILEKDRQLWDENKPIEVGSAFGGVALVDTKAYTHSWWSTNQHSEHVNFCRDMRKFGPICIIPNCKTRSVIDPSVINLDSFKNTAERQKQILHQTNKIYNISISEEIQINNA